MTVQRWHGGELRWDYWSAGWVVLAPDRDARPHDLDAPCPFCPGPGQDTPPETWRLTRPASSWRIRAVPNRYAVSDHHEVIIESPRHDWDLSTATDDEVVDVLDAWQHRHRALRAGAAQVVVFRNHGAAAGVSIGHPHSQVVGLPVISTAARHELDTQQAYHRTNGRTLADELITGELACGKRLLLANETAIAYVPFAPTADFELRITPTIPRADFAAVPASELTAVGSVFPLDSSWPPGSPSSPSFLRTPRPNCGRTCPSAPSKWRPTKRRRRKVPDPAGPSTPWKSSRMYWQKRNLARVSGNAVPVNVVTLSRADRKREPSNVRAAHHHQDCR